MLQVDVPELVDRSCLSQDSPPPAAGPRGGVRGQRSAVEQHPGIYDERAEHDDAHARARIEQLHRQQLGCAANSSGEDDQAISGGMWVAARVAPSARPNGAYARTTGIASRQARVTAEALACVAVLTPPPARCPTAARGRERRRP